jgi:hypothetical protein
MAVSSLAGFDVTWKKFDGDGVDVVVSEHGGSRGMLQVQVKSTGVYGHTKKPTFAYPLPLKNYDELRDQNSLSRSYLVVVVVPKKFETALAHNPRTMILKHCAYWHDLRGNPPVSAKTVSIQIDKSKCLTADSLRALMATAGLLS